MSKYFVPDSMFGQEAECPICACLWTDPVEIQGCEHILCRDCVQSLSRCPSCNHEITKLNPPNNAIIRMLMRVRGRCSSCAWKGTYKDFKESHKACLTAAQMHSVAKSAVRTSEEVKEAERMQDYYMEDNTPALPPYVAPPPWTAAKAAPAPWPTAQTTSGMYGPDPTEGGMLGNGASASAAQALTADEARRWRQTLTARARDYGLSESQFSSLKERFPDFATRAPNGGPALRWRGACRLLRYYNYPNHPDDVKDLFETAQQSPSTGSVSFHTLCLWLPLNQRNPQQWYGMNNDDYLQILRVAQVLDEAKKGLFTLDQAFLLGEQYFQRDLSPQEWDTIVKGLREKDNSIRQSFMSYDNYSLVNRDSGGQSGDVKLPFHDVLVTFRAHVESLKKQQVTASRVSRSEVFSRRIKRMIQHYEPAAMETIDSTIAKFEGEEEALLQTLIAMYGPEPAGY